MISGSGDDSFPSKAVAQGMQAVGPVGRVGCATRKVSLRVVHMIWAGGCCGGVLLRHWPLAFPTPLPRVD